MKKLQNLVALMCLSLLVGCVNESREPSTINDGIILSRLTQQLKERYSPQLILIAIEHIAPNGLLEDEMQEADHESYAPIVERFLINHPDTIDVILYDLASRGSSEPVIRRLYQWCNIYTVLMNTNMLDMPVYNEEVLYRTSAGKLVIDNMLVSPDQDWNSLSSTQLTDLPYRFSTYLSELNNVDQIAFLHAYYQCIESVLNAN